MQMGRRKPTFMYKVLVVRFINLQKLDFLIFLIQITCIFQNYCFNQFNHKCVEHDFCPSKRGLDTLICTDCMDSTRVIEEKEINQ